jgi:hypothetical protein
MGRTGWHAKFPEPIPLADGSKLATLRDAIAHLGKIILKPNMTSGGKPPQTGRPTLRNIGARRGISRHNASSDQTDRC